MKYIVKKEYKINDYVIGTPGDQLEITDAVPSPGETAEDVAGYCDIHNMTTGKKFEATWNDVDDCVEAV